MKLVSKSDADTKDVGFKIGKKLKPGDVVCMYGELGSGKTTMVKGIASAFGIKERDITSASFTIIAEYDASVPFYHIDLYRVTPEGAQELGLHEYPGTDGIAVIEWAERAGEDIPEKSIRIKLAHIDDNLREIEIEGIEI
ncbi:MAG: tRNA (adenosine(37)-N6)-threonylcarbamoyltransferase complex ATPase subunit type 1 TsaE [Nitrospirae bacterium]|nr:tRNA (adenosine(37)-N6)-threonylcarbamoyltransferase complex ATPase subunit type 1 TsaE [Nitrospirota bacterium]